MKIFGREPALWIMAIYATLMMLSTLMVRGFDEPLAAGVQLLLTAIATAVAALMVKPVAPTVWTGVIAAAAALATRFHFELDEAQIASITSFAAAIMMLVARMQQTPVADPADGVVVARDSRATL